MTLDDFKASLNGATPGAGLLPLLLALWHDAKGDWDAAHSAAQDVDDEDDEDGAWVHAYLHRKEGDEANAGSALLTREGCVRPKHMNILCLLTHAGTSQ